MKQQMALRESGGDPQEMRPKMMAIRTDQQTKIKALLTDDQKPKYDAYLASMPQGRRRRPRRRRYTPSGFRSSSAAAKRSGRNNAKGRSRRGLRPFCACHASQRAA